MFEVFVKSSNTNTEPSGAGSGFMAKGLNSALVNEADEYMTLNNKKRRNSRVRKTLEIGFMPIRYQDFSEYESLLTHFTKSHIWVQCNSYADTSLATFKKVFVASLNVSHNYEQGTKDVTIQCEFEETQT